MNTVERYFDEVCLQKYKPIMQRNESNGIEILKKVRKMDT
jgi:hypothetical protein